MANYVYPTSEYPAVRGAIGLGVDEISLPDDILDLSVYKGEAERWIMRQLTETQWSDNNNLPAINYAATHYLASLVTPTLRLVQSERIPAGNLTYVSTDLNALAQELLGRATAKMSQLLEDLGDNTPDNTSQFPFFTVAKRNLKF